MFVGEDILVPRVNANIKRFALSTFGYAAFCPIISTCPTQDYLSLVSTPKRRLVQQGSERLRERTTRQRLHTPLNDRE